MARAVWMYYYEKYIGTNKAAILAMVNASGENNVTSSEVGNSWYVTNGSDFREFRLNDYVCMVPLGGLGSSFSVSPSEFTAQFRTADQMAAEVGATSAFTAAVNTCTAASTGGFGSLPSITVPGLGNANFDVPIRPVQASNTFTAVPFLTGSSSLLGSLSITGLSNGTVSAANKLSTTTNNVTVYDRVRVNVANSGALQLAGAALLVHVTP